ncbi:TetR/AcrR family transcriptional regulator [Williamsia sp.]|uniref:TetR/AcrR family transcriptional regulator n=1 Tax=Williamsia sp. TaxID=1872085 RepID=UPI0025F75E3F|nr:TetR/AcrR family transcriptional regulator [Williamsia sp.]
MAEETGRRYAGQDPATRRAARRDQLMAAGLDLFATHGYTRVSVKQVCDQAKLTQRYFYESFEDREGLLLGVYDAVVADTRSRVDAAIAESDSGVVDLAQSALGAFIGHLTDDPRLARIMLLEVVGVSPRLEDRRYRVIHDFADLILVAATTSAQIDDMSSPQFRLVAVGLVGAVNQLLVDWVLGNGSHDPDEILAVCTGLFAAAFDRFYDPT